MQKQRGQTLVEFALVLPMMVLFIFGMIYGALIFMDYLDFSNEARTIARRISVTTDEDQRLKYVEKYCETKAFNSFYTMERDVFLVDESNTRVTDSEGKVKEDANANDAYDVIVTVTFTRNNKDLPTVLQEVGFPPSTVRPIVYRMKLEKLTSS